MSVLAQSYPDLEVLVMDGGSADATGALVREIARRDPRVRLLENPGRRIPNALNVGLRAARGKYVARVDAHATVSHTYLERGIAILEADPEVAAVGGRRIGVAGARAGQAVATALSSPFGVGDSINHYATAEQDTDHASFGVFHAAVVREVGGWDERLPVNEDVDLDHRILKAGHRIRYDPQMHILWHVQTTLRGLGRQYRRYGRGKAAMVRKNGVAAVRPRHLAPPALVLMLIGCAGASAIGCRRAAAVLAVPYPVALAAAVAITWRQLPPVRSHADGIRLAGAFATMHLAWGLGFLEGITTRASPTDSSGRGGDVIRVGRRARW
jgi:succinoglycan biosynthesis protein ExoA